MSKTTNSNILKESLYQAMIKSLGIVTTACKNCDCDRSTYYEYYKTDPVFKAKIDSIKDIALDFVETAHYKLIQDGNPSSIIFHLKTKGKNRGYQESIEHTNINLNKDIDESMSAEEASKIYSQKIKGD